MKAELETATPFDGEALLGFLMGRAVAGVEEVEDGVYRRSVGLAGGPAILELRPLADRVVASLALAERGDADDALRRCADLFDLDADPEAVLEVLGADPLLAPLCAAAPGRRVPGVVDASELAFRAVLGQQISVAAARTQAARLMEICGEPLAEPVGTITHLFPSPAAIAALPAERLAMPRSRSRALLALATALAAGELELGPGADRERSRAALMALPGIGPWTTEYIAMRALRDRDAFLAGDLGIRNALLALGVAADPASAEQRAEAWRPFRAYALQHLWGTLALPARKEPAGDGRR